uniref:Uncharacterized protein n=1 Tax=Aegilops tauschii subsp. strangulata TaxID=200361 RepID=A0A453RYT9_AEGTS
QVNKVYSCQLNTTDKLIILIKHLAWSRQNGFTGSGFIDRQQTLHILSDHNDKLHACQPGWSTKYHRNAQHRNDNASHPRERSFTFQCSSSELCCRLSRCTNPMISWCSS